MSSGTRLGPYEIAAPLGAGGMGEVYRARDTRLGRDVAIKILPDHVTEDPLARARFEREAKIVSSLNHPNICTLYDVGRHEGVEFLVMEFLEGETLGDRLKRGTPEIEEILRLGGQIAAALDAAHRRGLVHRDVKPDNIMLTNAGAKLLDFGLVRSANEMSAGSSLTASPTATSPLTQQGAVLGTIGYMSPEQLEGRDADARADIFALGAVLYEMVTGRRAFEGATQANVIASMLKDEPRPMATLQPLTPPALERLVRSCLAKNPEQRWRSAGDLARQLQWILEEGTTESGTFTATPTPATRTRPMLLFAAAAGWLIAAIVLAAYFLGPLRSSESPAMPSIRAQIPAPAHVSEWNFIFGGPMKISPDGRRIVVVVQEQGRNGLWIHDLQRGEGRQLQGTAGASFPFWSPDSRTVSFFADGKLKKIPADGGVVQPLCDAPDGRGGAWSRRGVIVFAPNVWGPLHIVPEGGGAPEPLTPTPDDLSHRFPCFLPDGQHFTFLQSSLVGQTGEIMIASLDVPQPRKLRNGRTSASFAAGHLLFEEQGTLFAQSLDLKRWKLTGGSITLADDVMSSPEGMGIVNFSVSGTGILAYYGAYSREQILEWLDADGKLIRRLGKPDYYSEIALSPDGGRILAGIESGSGDEAGLWFLDANTAERSGSVVRGESPVWSPDGERFAVQADLEIVVGDALRGTARTLLKLEMPATLADWSPDGRSLIFVQQDEKSGALNAISLDLEGNHEIRPLVTTPYWDFPGRISPDGRYLAFASDRRNPGSSSYELFVTDLGESEGIWQISTEGAQSGVGRALCDWSTDGKRLYYVSRAGLLMRVDIDTTTGFKAGMPAPASPSVGTVSRVNVAPDGRLLVLRPSEDQAVPPIQLLTNWTALLED